MTFQRARSEEQKQIRRQAILDTAAAMLSEMPVAEVSLNELSRRAGLAKSNVLRYFESREAVLLDLLDDALGSWLAELAEELSAGIKGPLESRAHQLACILSSSLANRRTLLDLFGAQGGVLERNISVDVAKRHKRASLARLKTMTALVQQHLPELGEGAQNFCLVSLVTAGALSSYVPAPASLLAAYAEEPDLGVLQVDLQEALHLAFTSALMGVLPRA